MKNDDNIGVFDYGELIASFSNEEDAAKYVGFQKLRQDFGISGEAHNRFTIVLGGWKPDEEIVRVVINTSNFKRFSAYCHKYDTIRDLLEKVGMQEKYRNCWWMLDGMPLRVGVDFDKRFSEMDVDKVAYLTLLTKLGV